MAPIEHDEAIDVRSFDSVEGSGDAGVISRIAAGSDAPIPRGGARFTDRFGLFEIGVVIGLLTAVRIAVLFATNLQLYGDEAQYWVYGQDLAFGYYSKPPMIGWLARLTTWIGGNSEAWVRIGSPIIQGATALLLYGLAGAIYGRTTAFFSAVAYATLPAASLASMLLSTDTPLLLFWVAALLALWRLLERGGLFWALLLGLAVGGGLLSKYAMGYLFVGLAVYAVLSPMGRALARNPRLWLGLVIGLLLFAPNVWWNLNNGGATAHHIVENANLDGKLWRPGAALRFFASQFAVIGPVFFAVFLIRLFRAPILRLAEHERFLVAFSLPVLVIIQGQALLANANANWAATAIPAALILATGLLVAGRHRIWMAIALGINAIVLLALTLAVLSPALVSTFAGNTIMRKMQGWREFAVEVSRRAEECGCPAVLLDHRIEFSELRFYGTLDPGRLYIKASGKISNHFELTRPLPVPVAQRTLYVSRRVAPNALDRALGHLTSVGEFKVSTGRTTSRTYHAYVLEAEPRNRSEGPR